MTTISKVCGCVYSKADIHQLQLASIILNAYGVQGDCLEVSATSFGDIGTAITGLTDARYDYFFIGTTISTSGTGVLDRASVDTIITDKLTAATVALAEATPFKAVATLPDQSAGSSTHIVFDTDASTVNDYYNKKILKITYADTTIQYSYIFDYIGASKQAYISTAASGTVAGGTFEVMDYSAYVLEVNAADALGRVASIQAWQLIHSTNGIPLSIKCPANYKWALSHGLAQSANATDLVLLATVNPADCYSQTLHDTNDIYNDAYAYIATSTLGKGLYAKITDYTGASVTAKAAFSTTPTGSIYYSVVQNLWQILYTEYIKMYWMVYLTDLTSSDTLFKIKKLLDDNSELATENGIGTPQMNKTYFAEVLTAGKALYDGYCAGISTP